MDEIRKKAESLLKNYNLDSPEFEKLNKKEIIHELLVYQKELEIQNEEIKATNEKLEKLKEEYFYLFNCAPVGYIVLDEMGMILKCNKTFLNFINSDPYRVTKRPFINFLYEKDKRKFISAYKDFYENPKDKYLDIRLINENTIIHTLITGKRDRDNLLLTITDVTALKEEQIQKSLFLEAIENAPVSILIANKDKKIIYTNNYFLKLTGYDRDEVVGKVWTVFSDIDNTKDYKGIFDEIEKNKEWEGIFLNKIKNGETLIFETKIKALLNEYGEITNYVIIKNDITEKKKNAEKEKDYEKAKALMTVSTGLAHHLNNLNTPIMLTSQMLYETTKDEKLKSNLRVIIKSVEKMTKIINAILNFSKNIRIHKKINDANSIVEKALTKSKDLIFNNISISFNSSEEVILIEVDEELLVHALINLIKNAIEAMPQGGIIRIKTFTKLLNRDGNLNKFAVIEISDNGIGIPEHIKPYIFDPFFTTKFIGTSYGLGLAEAKGIVEQHNGFIEFESTINKGSTFYVYIPEKEV